MPPVLPGAREVNNRITRALPGSVAEYLRRGFPHFFTSALTELPTEEGAGLGLGVALLGLAGMACTLRPFARGGAGTASPKTGAPGACPASARTSAATSRADAQRSDSGVRANCWGEFFQFRLPWLAIAAWVAGAVYLLKMGSEAAPRLMLPYYPLMLAPFLLLPGQARLLQFRAGRILALLAALSILPGLILSAARPLWPGRSICERLAREHAGGAVLQRLASVYSAYSHRNDLLAPLRDHLPPEARQIGFIASSNDTDYSLWRPFGRRRVIYPGYDLPDFLAHPGGVEWLVVKEDQWPATASGNLADWAQASHYRMVCSTDIVALVSWGPERWTLLHRGE
jgi:hypothetical protein